MAVVPFHNRPADHRDSVPLFVGAAPLAVGLALRSVLDRYLAEDDPPRLYIGQAILYGGTPCRCDCGVGG